MKRLLTVVGAGILGLAGCKGVDAPAPNTQVGLKGTATGQFQTQNTAGSATVQTAYRPTAGAAAVQQAGGPAVQQGAVVTAVGQSPMACPTGTCNDPQVQPVQVGGAVQGEAMMPVKPTR